ncbi:MAG: TatD family hydrolase [Parcubacteria group bacterium]|nr:TatD family hydrolase [Parcubacteria group bacterium]
MLIDTHGHVNFNAFKGDAQEVLRRALDSDIWVVMPGTQYSTSKRAVEMAGQYEEGVYAAVGIHPIHLGEKRHVDGLELQSALLETARPGRAQFLAGFETRSEEFEYEKYKLLARSERVVAIGEVGLDYYYESKNKTKREEARKKQRHALREQMKLAQELNLSVIFHCRKAHEDLLALIDGWNGRGVVHCYTGTTEQARRFVEKGLHIGFNGLILKQVPALPSPEEVVSSIPLERIVLETDSPYLAPPQAKEERNEPLNVQYVAEEIARIKSISLEEVARVTTQNAKTLFGI